MTFKILLTITRREVVSVARISSEEFNNTKYRLLEVGLNFFESKGYSATGLQEIARQAGISKGSFYSYFPSKEDFGVAVIDYYTQRSLTSWRSMLLQAIKTEDASSALKITFFNTIEKYKDSEEKKGCLVGTLAAEICEASEVCRAELNRSVEHYKNLISKYVTLGQNQGGIRNDLTPEKLAGMIWDCWQGGLLRMKIENSIKPVINDLTLLFEIISPQK